MEEFGDWIYILIIVIAGISSLISSTRKKAREAAELNKPREVIVKSDREDDFWGSLTQQTEVKPAVSENQPKRSSKRPFLPVEKQTQTFLDMYQEGQPAIQSTETAIAEPIENQSLFTVDDMPENIGEWRKAFVYNEIFARKN